MIKNSMIWVGPIVAAFLAAESSAAAQKESSAAAQKEPTAEAQSQNAGIGVEHVQDDKPISSPSAEIQTEVAKQVLEEAAQSKAKSKNRGSWSIAEKSTDSKPEAVIADESKEQAPIDELPQAAEDSTAREISDSEIGLEVNEPPADLTSNEESASQGEQAVLDADNKSAPSDAIEPSLTADAIKLEARQLSENLEQQYKALRKTLETEDSFSLELAENYFGYGKLLKQSGELEDAADAFVDALHIQKINHGIYAPEQRPVLKELFETHYALGNVEEFENYLDRILWIESHNPDLDDDFSFHILVSVGNQYLDDFLSSPTAGVRNVENLLRAKSHIRSAIKRHKSKPLSLLFLPYGELALIGFLESRIYSDVDKTSSILDHRIKSLRNLEGRELALASYLDDSFPRGVAHLKGYLKKATEENDVDHVVGAFMALGDYHQLFSKTDSAITFYRLAWQAAQNLPEDSPRHKALSTTTALPAFEYAQSRSPIIPARPSVLVPVKLTVNGRGKVLKVDKFAADSKYAEHSTRARRAARNLIFRPMLENGEIAETRKVDYDIRIYTRKKAGASDT